MLILQSYDYVLFDGAFGTYYSKKYHSEQPCENTSKQGLWQLKQIRLLPIPFH